MAKIETIEYLKRCLEHAPEKPVGPIAREPRWLPRCRGSLRVLGMFGQDHGPGLCLTEPSRARMEGSAPRGLFVLR